MRRFDVDDDLVLLVSKLAGAELLDGLSFNDGLRRVLMANGAEALERTPKPVPKPSPGKGLLVEQRHSSATEGSDSRHRLPKADLRELVRLGRLTEGQELFLIDYQGDRISDGKFDVKATIAGPKLKYKGEVDSMSAFAGRLLQQLAGWKTSSFSGPRHWATADGTSVWNLWLEVLKNKKTK